MPCHVATLIFRPGLMSVKDIGELSLRVIPDHSSAAARSFRARIDAWDRAHASCTATRPGARCDSMWRPSSLGQVSETLWSSLWECFLSIAQPWRGPFEHGSVCRDRAHAVCTAARPVAGCDAMWRVGATGDPRLQAGSDVCQRHCGALVAGDF